MNKSDKTKLAGKKGYDDSKYRNAFREMVKKCKVLQNFLVDYFKLDLSKPYITRSNPLGKYSVDLGIICKITNTIVGLVEVDHYKKWTHTWPSNYKFCNRVDRKEKYYQGTSLPYINITFNVQGTDGIMTTREIEQSYPITEWYIPEVDKYQKGRQVSLEDAIRIGGWVQ